MVVQPLSSNRPCCLDPIPSTVFAAAMIKSLKTAVVCRHLKKPDADHNQFSNFRPVSNLSLISKINEKAVAVQLTNYIVNYHMDKMFQSA